MSRAAPVRADYVHFRSITTRWADNDVYGHVNNVVYYSFFDTVVNGWLVDQGLLDPGTSPVIGLVVETRCSYFAPLAFPQRLEGALRVDRVGRSSVTYGLAIFAEGAQTAAAAGDFTHVHVDAHTRRPVPLPDALRARLAVLAPPEG